MNSSKTRTIAIILYSMSLAGLLIYSYSQIDLNLTLSSNSWYQTIQQQLIGLGYFHRNFSGAIYLAIILFLFVLQFYFFRQASKEKISVALVWKLSLLSALILLFAYPAFSHDVFNYIFDTRILVTHRVNPLQFTALDFPNDLWTRFMHWTHRTYPYGPTWLPLTVPFYIAGAGKFTLTLLAYKVIGAGSYLASIWSIQKILNRISPINTAPSLVLFALNPLILIESLVSTHLDTTMTALFLISLYLALEQKKVGAWMMFLASIGIKFVTVAALPVWIWWNGKKERFHTAVSAMLVLIIIATGVAIFTHETLPWYFITPLALVPLLPKKTIMGIYASAISMGLMLRYLPYLLRGDYSNWVKTTRDWLTLIPVGIATIGFLWAKRKSFLSFSS